MMHWGGDFGMGFNGGIFMILFWVLLILGVVYLVKLLLGGGSASEKKNESARGVLEKRFARGEITREEFEDAVETLRRNKV